MGSTTFPLIHLGDCDGRWKELNFFVRGHGSKKVRETCGGCPVREQCREWAVPNELHWYFGGLSERERYALREALGIEHPSVSSDVIARSPDSPHNVSGASGIEHDTPRGYARHRKYNIPYFYDDGKTPCKCLKAHSDQVKDCRIKKKAERAEQAAIRADIIGNE